MMKDGTPMAQKALHATWTYIDEMVRSRSSIEVERILLNLAEHYGLKSVFGGVIPTHVRSPHDVVDLVLIQQLPLGWAERYRLKNYLLRDPILRRLQADSRTLFTWSEAYATASRDDVLTVGGEARDFGLKDGIVVPIDSLDHCPIAVSFGGPEISLDEYDVSALRFATTYAIGQILYHRSKEQDATASLTSRERDCLQWAAEGKSDWDIGKILGISPGTVEKHNLAIRTKLGAVNRGHAIAKALRLQLIR